MRICVSASVSGCRCVHVCACVFMCFCLRACVSGCWCISEKEKIAIKSLKIKISDL